jgi:hypothetical protein
MEAQAQSGKNLEGVRRAALEIATKRAQDLRTIKQALLEKNLQHALALMHEFFSIESDKGTGNDKATGNRVNPRIN